MKEQGLKNKTTQPFNIGRGEYHLEPGESTVVDPVTFEKYKDHPSLEVVDIERTPEPVEDEEVEDKSPTKKPSSKKAGGKGKKTED